jgi:hypothetical protein
MWSEKYVESNVEQPSNIRYSRRGLYLGPGEDEVHVRLGHALVHDARILHAYRRKDGFSLYQLSIPLMHDSCEM